MGGYIDGTVIVWELQTNKLVTVQECLHESEVVSAKIYDVEDSDNLLSLISVERDGAVYNSKIERSVLRILEPEVSVN